MEPDDLSDLADPSFSAVVLAGGTAVRLDGADKASVEWRRLFTAMLGA